MARITKEHALKIARKLRATIDKSGKAHDLALIYHNGRLVASFGIRRGSRKNLGHGHIPADLHLQTHDTVKLANCTLSVEEWVQKMIDAGWIEPEQAQ